MHVSYLSQAVCYAPLIEIPETVAFERCANVPKYPDFANLVELIIKYLLLPFQTID